MSRFLLNPLSRSTRSWNALCERQIRIKAKQINSFPNQKFPRSNPVLVFPQQQHNGKTLMSLSAAAVLVSLGVFQHKNEDKTQESFVHARVEPSQSCKRANQLAKWTLYDEIGYGAFGVVKLGKCVETGEMAAVKVLDASRNSTEVLEREIGAMKKIQQLGGHDNIIALKDVFVQGQEVALVTELATGGELFDLIVENGALDEKKAAGLMKDICQAVHFLHSECDLVHKDLKPENLLLSSEKRVKVADFGSAGPKNEQICMKMKESTGTMAYWSPEILSSGKVSDASDMWAVGCILYIMLSGSHPFDVDGTASDELVENRIQSSKVTFDLKVWDFVSDEAKGLIENLLEKDPAKRMNARQLLVHPWLQQCASA